MSNAKQATATTVNWRMFYKHILALVIPLALQNLVNVSITAADVFMLGRVDEVVLAGAAIAGQVQFIMMLTLFGLSSGLTILTAQYWGKGEVFVIEKILAMGLKVALSVTFVFMSLALLLPTQILGLFTRDTAVIAQGVIYLRIVAFSYMMIGFTLIYLAVMRSVERVIVATVIFSISLVINVSLNAVLIFGLFGFPALGIQGAAIGTLITRSIEVCSVLIYSRFFNHNIKIRLRYFLKSDPILRRDFIKYALPVLFNEIVWGVAVSVNTAILGHMGSAALAANSVAQVSRQLGMVVAFGLSGATAVYVGKTIGKRMFEEARLYATRLLQLSVLSGVVGGVLLLIASPHIITAQSLSPEAANYLRLMYFVMAYFMVAQSFTVTTIVGVLRSGGDTRFGLVCDLCSMWFFSIPLSFIGAFFLGFSVPVVYIILMSDELVKIPFALWRFRSLKWLRNVTKEIEKDSPQTV